MLFSYLWAIVINSNASLNDRKQNTDIIQNKFKIIFVDNTSHFVFPNQSRIRDIVQIVLVHIELLCDIIRVIKRGSIKYGHVLPFKFNF